MVIEAKFEIIRGMAGNVKYYNRPCPHGEKPIQGVVAFVGSTACKLCKYYEASDEVKTETKDVFAECVTCNHD